MKVTWPDEKLHKAIIAPHVSEKATNVMRDNQHVFRVLPDATRAQVRAAIENAFDVKVAKVNLVRVKGKRKGTGRSKGRRVDWKKAYVTLEAGNSIDLTASE